MMRQFLPFFKEEEFIDQELSVQAGLEMKFQDKRLVRCLAFAKHRRQVAINICQKDIAAGIFCVLTESDTHFTIWREQLSEGQKVDIKTSSKLKPQLNKSQPSLPKEKRISSQINEFDLIDVTSSPRATINHSAADPGFQILETTVQPINDKTSHTQVLRHKPAFTVAKTKPPKFKTTPSNIGPSPRSAFLARFNQELTQHVGPIADYLINELLAKRPNIEPQQMIEAIVAEIPDPTAAQKVQASLERLIYKFTETM